jgi:hypothetical protein
LVVFTTELTMFSSQYGQSGQGLFFLTGWPPRIASLLALVATFACAGTTVEAAAVTDAAVAAATN